MAATPCAVTLQGDASLAGPRRNVWQPSRIAVPTVPARRRGNGVCRLCRPDGSRTR